MEWRRLRPRSFCRVTRSKGQEVTFMSWKNTSITVFAFAALSCATPASSALAEPVRGAAGGYEVEVLVNGVPTPTFFHSGETYALGRMGERYTLRVWNRSSRRVEAVVSVDGRDVIDGKPGDFRGKRGYLVPAWGSVDIDGWRLSDRQAAAFRFTTVSDSYAGRTGSARNVGVIGVAVFPERVYMPRPRPRPLYPDYDSSSGGGSDQPLGGLLGDDSRGPRAEAEPPAPASPAAGAGRSQDKAGEAPRSSASADGALAEKRAAPRRERPGLGTQFGEEVYSHVREVSFTRANPSNPAVLLGVRYNDREGLIAMGIDVDGRYYNAYEEQDLRRTAEPFPVSERRYSAPPPGWRRY
jgi:hypothetical protein